NPIVAPVQVTEWWWLAENEVMEMTKRGVPGVWTYNYYDGWVPNYLFWIGVTHNSIGRFYETQSYVAAGGRGGGGRRGGAAAGAAGEGAAGDPPNPNTAVDQPPPAQVGGLTNIPASNSREWYRPFPNPGDVVWSGRANVNMQQSALLITLNLVAK